MGECYRNGKRLEKGGPKELLAGLLKAVISSSWQLKSRSLTCFCPRTTIMTDIHPVADLLLCDETPKVEGYMVNNDVAAKTPIRPLPHL